MTQFFKNSLKTLTVLLASMTVSCVDTDGTSGNTLLPPDWEMQTVIDDSIMPQTHVFAYDSVMTSPLENAFYVSSDYKSNVRVVGSYIDPLVGRTTSHLFSNLRPFGKAVSSGTYFGKDPVVDSMKMVLSFVGFVGDTLVGREIKVYEVTGGKYKAWIKYYNTFKIAPFLAPEPLATFTLKSPMYKVVDLPVSFAQKLMVNTQNATNPYSVDTLFHNFFKGLYITSDKATSGEGSMYGLDISTTLMTMFYHNDNTPKDTTTVIYYMYDPTYSQTPRNTNFSIVEYDYSFADPSKGGVEMSTIGNLTTPSKMGYIQGLGGLGTKITIPQSQIDNLMAKVRALGYNDIAIHSAELVITTQNTDADNLDMMHQQIAPYYSLEKFEFAPDYHPVNTTTTPDYGGNLNRTLGIYKLNIVSYLQQLVHGKTTNHSLELSATLQNYMFINRSAIMGSESAHPPRLVLTYTMVK